MCQTRCNEWPGFVILRPSAVLATIATPPHFFYPAVTKKLKNTNVMCFLVVKEPVVKGYQNRNRAIAFERAHFQVKVPPNGPD